MSYEQQRAYADQFNHHLLDISKRIVLDYRLFSVSASISNLEQDTKKGTDGIVKAEPISVSWRVRDKKFEPYFHKDFTIRYSESGKSEWDKFLMPESYASFMFIGLVDASINDVLAVNVLDVSKARENILSDSDLKARILSTDRAFSTGRFVAPQYQWFDESVLITREVSPCTLQQKYQQLAN